MTGFFAESVMFPSSAITLSSEDFLPLAGFSSLSIFVSLLFLFFYCFPREVFIRHSLCHFAGVFGEILLPDRCSQMVSLFTALYMFPDSLGPAFSEFRIYVVFSTHRKRLSYPPLSFFSFPPVFPLSFVPSHSRVMSLFAAAVGRLFFCDPLSCVPAPFIATHTPWGAFCTINSSPVSLNHKIDTAQHPDQTPHREHHIERLRRSQQQPKKAQTLHHSIQNQNTKIIQREQHPTQQ